MKADDALDFTVAEGQVGLITDLVVDKGVAGHFPQTAFACPRLGSLHQGAPDACATEIGIDVPAFNVANRRGTASLGIGTSTCFDEAAQPAIGPRADEDDHFRVFPEKVGHLLMVFFDRCIGPQCPPEAQPFFIIRWRGAADDHVLLLCPEVSIVFHVYTWRESGVLRDEWGQLVDSAKLRCRFDIPSPQCLAHVIKLVGVVERKIRRPSLIGDDRVYIDLGKIAALADEFCPAFLHCASRFYRRSRRKRKGGVMESVCGICLLFIIFRCNIMARDVFDAPVRPDELPYFHPVIVAMSGLEAIRGQSQWQVVRGWQR